MKLSRIAMLGPLILVALACGHLLPAMSSARQDGAAEAPPPSRWIGVSVATLWVGPDRARAIDAPACANPADPRVWIRGMTIEQKRWLVGRLETQATYGTKVYLLATSGAWSKIAVPGQPTPRNKWGYPGWVPTRQLATTAPRAAPRVAVVRSRTAWLWGTTGLTGRVLELSYGTRLPAVAWSRERVEVIALDGRHLYARRTAMTLHVPGGDWPELRGAKLVSEARLFLGQQYLWAGTSGFGVDCSGFTHLVYAALGTTIPRDGGPQFEKGRKIAKRSSLRPGDLVFFRDSAGDIHHVGLYVGRSTMIHAPRTGRAVAETSILSEPYLSEFAGGRRFTP